jgi:murein DD-endopeptidase MepM/ murein hydrolase activator NlpD
VASLSTAAVWIAYAWPSQAPAMVPSTGVASPFTQQSPLAQRIVVATLQGTDVLLPVPPNDTTAVAFQAVDDRRAVPFMPVGRLGDPSGPAGALADIFASRGLRYYTMKGDSSATSAPTAGLDVGAVPGATVFAPLDGQVTAVTDYLLLGRYPDTEVDLQPADDPGVILAITHLAGVRVEIGDTVTAGQTVLGAVRGFPDQLYQPLRQFTTDDGDHVEMMAEPVPTSLDGS